MWVAKNGPPQAATLCLIEQFTMYPMAMPSTCSPPPYESPCGSGLVATHPMISTPAQREVRSSPCVRPRGCGLQAQVHRGQAPSNRVPPPVSMTPPPRLTWSTVYIGYHVLVFLRQDAEQLTILLCSTASQPSCCFTPPPSASRFMLTACGTASRTPVSFLDSTCVESDSSPGSVHGSQQSNCGPRARRRCH